MDQSIDSLYLRSVGFIDTLNGWIGILSGSNILYETHDGGINWSPVKNLPSQTPPGICGIWVENDTVIYACGRFSDGAGILKTTDKGNSWTYIDMNPYMTGLVDMYFFNPDTGFVVGQINNSSNSKAVVFYTADGGLTWELKHTSAHTGEWAWKIVFPTANTGYVSIQNTNLESYILKSTDGGETWEDKLIELSLSNGTEGIGFISGDIGWGGPDEYMIQTTDGGNTWSYDSVAQFVNRFRILSDTLGYACGKTVYKFTSENISGVGNNILVIPDNYKLAQNFPNPFNSMTTIIFSVPVEGFTNLSVYSVTGELVYTLVNEIKKTGIYEVRINANKWASGIYLYKLKSESFIETKKMVLLR